MKCLREIRRDQGLTQSELAANSGLRQATVSALENGRTKAHPGTILALANALQCDSDRIRECLNVSKHDQSGQTKEKSAACLEEAEPENLGELAWNWSNAQRAVAPHARQWKEAMMFLDPILKKHPEFLAARKLMREAEIQAALKIPLSDRIPPPQSYIGKAQKKVDKAEFFGAMELLEEKVFVYLPTNINANIVLHEAAVEAGLLETARFALEFAAEQNSEDPQIFQKLAEYYQQIGELDHACASLKRITLLLPDDLEAAKEYRDMVARASMNGEPLR